jgi:hypothetical protein
VQTRKVCSLHSPCSLSNEEDNAYVAYEDLYLKAIHELEHELDSDLAYVNSISSGTEGESKEPQSEPHEALQSPEAHCQLVTQAVSPVENTSKLGGSINLSSSSSPNQGESITTTRQERRKLQKDAKHVLAYLRNLNLTSWAPNSLIKLRRLMSRPAGCAFLGSSASPTC